MSAAAPALFTEDEYLDRERRSETKSELLHGVIVAMAGASPKHNAIVMNLGAALKLRLKGRRCLVFPSDQRVHVEATGLFTYPDVTVVCDKPRLHPKDRDTLLNPKVVVEVLSSSTEAYDLGAKFAHYQSIRSFEEYVLVTQSGKRVEHFRRIETGQWLLTVSEGDDSVLVLPALGCEIPLSEIYENADILDEAAAGGP
ncbi:MAG: Uma2 family endonuclease [Polyangiaceae bacterium]|nr:Uma2 family endonuclease [Polyangiaceae bacterium]